MHKALNKHFDETFFFLFYFLSGKLPLWVCKWLCIPQKGTKNVIDKQTEFLRRGRCKVVLYF